MRCVHADDTLRTTFGVFPAMLFAACQFGTHRSVVYGAFGGQFVSFGSGTYVAP
jgi:hypothetical protein